MARSILSTVNKVSTFFYRQTGKLDWNDLIAAGAYNPERKLDANLTRMGFVHPLAKSGEVPEGDESALMAYPQGFITALRVDKSVVTRAAIGQAVNAEIAARLEELPEEEGLSRDERSAIHQAMHDKLVSDAPEVSRWIPILIDTDEERIYIFDNGAAIIKAITARFNNAFAGQMDLLPWASVAAKSDVENAGIAFLNKLQNFLAAKGDEAEAMFDDCPSLSFGAGVKLSKLDGTQGNDVTLSQFDLGDSSLKELATRASFSDRIGLFYTHGNLDIELQVTSKLQVAKLSLGLSLESALEEDELENSVTEMQASATLISGLLNPVISDVSKFLGIEVDLS